MNQKMKEGRGAEETGIFLVPTASPGSNRGANFIQLLTIKKTQCQPL
jgi:hypothetical protein